MGTELTARYVPTAWQDNPPITADHVITDPPYDARTHTGHQLPIRGRAAVSFPPVDPAELVPELLRRTTGWIVCFCSLEQIGAYQAAAGGAWYRGAVWDKVNPAPQFNGQGPSQAVEGLAIIWAGWRDGQPRRRPQWEAGGRAGIWRCQAARGALRYHETDKPVELCRELVEDFTAPGDLIWDPFAGAAPVGVAAIHSGRSYWGNELDPRWHKVAAKRLQSAALAPMEPTARERLAARRAALVELRAAQPRS